MYWENMLLSNKPVISNSKFTSEPIEDSDNPALPRGLTNFVTGHIKMVKVPKLSKEHTTKTFIRLHWCAVWFVSSPVILEIWKKCCAHAQITALHLYFLFLLLFEQQRRKSLCPSAKSEQCLCFSLWGFIMRSVRNQSHWIWSLSSESAHLKVSFVFTLASLLYYLETVRYSLI